MLQPSGFIQILRMPSAGGLRGVAPWRKGSRPWSREALVRPRGVWTGLVAPDRLLEIAPDVGSAGQSSRRLAGWFQRGGDGVLGPLQPDELQQVPGILRDVLQVLAVAGGQHHPRQ